MQPDPTMTGRQILPLPDLEEWRGRVDRSRQMRNKVKDWWNANLKKYAPDQSQSPDAYGEAINTNRDFTLVERKKADLFFQRPDIVAVPSPLMEDHADLMDVHTKILNEKLGLDGVNARELVHQCIFDVLCPSGRGWSVMGYESATVPTPMPADPTTGQAPMDPQTGQPAMVPVPIYENVFWRWLSPFQGLVPDDARTVKADDWPWIGYDFEIPVRTAKRNSWVPDDYKGAAPSQEMRAENALINTSGDSVAKGCLLYYKSSLYRDDRPHPLHQTMLVLMDGVDTPAEHKDCPYQALDAQGRLTKDSLLGYAVHPLTIRILTDSADIPSDCTISRPLVNELNKFREQMVEQRDAQLLAYYYDAGTLPPETVKKALDARQGAFVGFPSEAFVGDGAIKEFPHGQYPRENFQFNDYLDNDLARTHAVDSSQSGAEGTHRKSATESQIMENNVNARLGLERGNVLDWYIQGVTKYSAIYQRLAPVEDAAAIVGPQLAAQWDAWRHQVPASLAFTALPDSALRPDLAQNRKRAMDEYTFLANDPAINKLELTKQLVPKLGYSMKVVNTQPQEPHPKPADISLALASASLNPMLPEYANLYQILTQQGVKGLVPPNPAAIMNQPPAEAPPNTDHGGKLAQMESLSKHANALTGGMQGTGAPAPMGPPPAGVQ